MKPIILLVVSLCAIDALLLGNSCGINDTICQNIVEVGLYVESLCPYSRAFIVDQLYPAYQRLSTADPPVLAIHLVTFGNARMQFINSTNNPVLNYTCQHKDPECEGNLIEGCSLYLLPIEQSLPFVTCMFNSTNWKSPWTAAQECAQQLNVDYERLKVCAESLEGTAIQYFMEGQTRALDPPHTGVPWITINGEHTDDMHEDANLTQLVCDAYQGPVKPAACTGILDSDPGDSSHSISLSVIGMVIAFIALSTL